MAERGGAPSSAPVVDTDSKTDAAGSRPGDGEWTIESLDRSVPFPRGWAPTDEILMPPDKRVCVYLDRGGTDSALRQLCGLLYQLLAEIDIGSLVLRKCCPELKDPPYMLAKRNSLPLNEEGAFVKSLIRYRTLQLLLANVPPSDALKAWVAVNTVPRLTTKRTEEGAVKDFDLADAEDKATPAMEGLYVGDVG
jgi:hypothetical protein